MIFTIIIIFYSQVFFIHKSITQYCKAIFKILHI